MFALIPLWAHVPIRQQPWTNLAIIAVTIIVSGFALFDEETLMGLAGYEIQPIPGMTLRESYDAMEVGWRPNLQRTLPAPVSGLTCTLAHSGVVHLVGNMLFLWVFGNAVNCKLGHARYLGLYVLAAVMAGVFHAVMTGRPVIGASGAINGVVAAFLVLFARKEITIAFWIAWKVKLVRVSSLPIIAFWLTWDGLMLLIGSGGVAHWAHIGGFVTGFCLTVMLAVGGWVEPGRQKSEWTLLQWMGIGRRIETAPPVEEPRPPLAGGSSMGR